MITTLTGNNDYQIKLKTSQIIADFKKKHDQLAIERLSIGEIDFNALKQSLLSYSLFADSRLVILDRPSENKQFVSSIDEIIASLPETTELLIIEPEIDKRLSYYKSLKKTNLVTYDKKESGDLVKWLSDQAKTLGGEIKPSEAKYLLERVGDDQLQLIHELEKLIIYDPHVLKESIDLLSEESAATTVFQLLDAAFAGQTKRAFKLYDKQRQAKVPAEQILSLFVRQLQIISACFYNKNLNASQLASKIGVQPFVIAKTIQTSKKLNKEGLKDLVGNLANIDSASKSYSLSLDQALKNFIIESAVLIS